ncbi:MAG: type II toxin-antitoxin system RelE/ParE family toxin [Balneolaceae bacterium]|nr:type II toxin-antitoxin system RelE/ParE family toxin [Balneolaceae bacterium]
MRILWTERAEKQLDQIYSYIATDSLLYAHRTIDQIIERAESLSRNPRKGVKVPEYADETIRQILYPPYRIIHLIKEDENTIEILSVLHTSREMPIEPEKM